MYNIFTYLFNLSIHKRQFQHSLRNTFVKNTFTTESNICSSLVFGIHTQNTVFHSSFSSPFESVWFYYSFVTQLDSLVIVCIPFWNPPCPKHTHSDWFLCIFGGYAINYQSSKSQSYTKNYSGRSVAPLSSLLFHYHHPQSFSFSFFN